MQVYIYKAVSELTVNSDIMLADLQSAKWKQDNIITEEDMDLSNCLVSSAIKHNNSATWCHNNTIFVMQVSWLLLIGMSALVGWLEFNVPFQHKYGYIRDERSGMESYPYPVKEG